MENMNDNGSGGCTPSSRRPEAWEQLHDEILAGLFAGEYGKAAVALPDLALTHSNAYRFGYGEGFVDLDEASDADLTRSTEAYKAVMHRLEKTASPTASASSTMRMSGSTCIAVENARRTYIPLE